ncbi:hypothetical protein [Bradyrhizobium diazoefficiens]|nr:hypothetical protein XF16B_46000 [Bradyrhizobium diazoefficiens]BCF70253.1 hypothetical protein XF19B_46060 [Bradyrhizobium diazoefficiens]
MADDKEQIRLLDLALDALEDEQKSWTRLGTWKTGVTRLVRNPLHAAPLGAPIDKDAEISFIDVPDSEVNGILTRVAMDKVVTMLRKELRG